MELVMAKASDTSGMNPTANNANPMQGGILTPRGQELFTPRGLTQINTFVDRMQNRGRGRTEWGGKGRRGGGASVRFRNNVRGGK